MGNNSCSIFSFDFGYTLINLIQTPNNAIMTYKSSTTTKENYLGSHSSSEELSEILTDRIA